MEWLFILSFPHIGIILIFVGTVFLTQTVRVKPGYEGGKLREVVDRARQRGMYELSEVRIDTCALHIGLALVAAGSLLQW